MNEKKALSVDAFCEIFSIGRTMAYEEMNAGRLKSIKVGRKRLIRAEAAEEWLQAYANRPNQSQREKA